MDDELVMDDELAFSVTGGLFFLPSPDVRAPTAVSFNASW